MKTGLVFGGQVKVLASYEGSLKHNFVLQDLKTFRRAPALLANPRVHELYPSFICNISRGLFQVDGQPRKKILKLARREMKGKISLRLLVKDLIQAGRALLWP